MSKFLEALDAGLCIVRKVWKNENSDKNQVSVQFIQKINLPETPGNNNILVAMAQGIEDAGKNKVTTIFSFEAEQAKKLGLVEGEYMEKDDVILAKDLFKGIEVGILVTENFTPNPLARTPQQPKINPKTKAPVTSGGRLVYRHTELAMGTAEELSAQSTFLPLDAVSAVSELDADEAAAEVSAMLASDAAKAAAAQTAPEAKV